MYESVVSEWEELEMEAHTRDLERRESLYKQLDMLDKLIEASEWEFIEDMLVTCKERIFEDVCEVESRIEEYQEYINEILS